MERSKDRGTMFKLAILWLSILLLGSFWLRIRFSTVTWILFIIFMGMVYTKIVMTLAT